jgi:hypothetical protein
VTQHRCTALTALTSAEFRALQALPPPLAHELEPILRCLLEADHRGEHMALGQTSGINGADWWLSWPVGDRQLQFLPICPATTEGDEEPETCLLPLGHEGAHDFELTGEVDN